MKTAAQLRTAIEAIFAAGVNFSLYLGTGPEENRVYQRANFDDGATASVCQTYITSIRRFFENEDLSTLQLSQMDSRSDTLFMYDLATQPADFAKLSALSAPAVPPPLFSFADTNLNAVKTLAIKISSAANSVIFFKQFYPVSLVKRDQILLVVRDNTRFSLIDQDIMKVSGGFEVLLLDGEFYINDFHKFEKAFGFEQIANQAMQAVTTRMLGMNLVEDSKGHLATFQASKKDILRATNSPVFDMPAASIIQFVELKQHQVGIKVLNGKLQLTSRDSIKKLYKLFNDDFLTSGLTAFEYETLAKSKII